MNRERIAEELVGVAKELQAKDIPYELWRGNKLLYIVDAPEGESIRKIKEQALHKAYLLGEISDLEPYIGRADVYYRPDGTRGKKKIYRGASVNKKGSSYNLYYVGGPIEFYIGASDVLTGSQQIFDLKDASKPLLNIVRIAMKKAGDYFDSMDNSPGRVKSELVPSSCFFEGTGRDKIEISAEGVLVAQPYNRSDTQEMASLIREYLEDRGFRK